MNKHIEADLFRYHGITGIKGVMKCWRIPGFRYMYFLRKAAAHKRVSVPGIFYAFIIHRLSRKYGYQIPANTNIGYGFYIGHFGTIVINGNAQIGKNCNIGHLVTIGQTNRGKLKGCPTIGDKVWIGTGSVIVGKIIIGSNVLIAPNSYVNVDVPPHSIVIGNPCTIIPRQNPCDGYINNVFE